MGKKPKVPSVYMPLPKGCDRGIKPMFDNIICIDTLICYYYCEDKCQEFVDYDRERMRISKENRMECKKSKRRRSGRRGDLDLDFSDRIEAGEKKVGRKKRKRKDLEL